MFLSSSQISDICWNMKLTLKKNWKSIMPLCSGGKTSIPFCIFPKVRSTSQSSGNGPVYLNVYDLTPMNGYMYWVGLGVFHTGIEVHGVEYAFGAHDYPTSGVFEVEPRQCPGFRFRKSIFVGTTCLDSRQVREFVEMESLNYNGDTYHLIVKNCNHFCEDIIYKLTGNSIPKWVNRLARIGSFCNCILPKALKITAIHQDPDSATEDGERRRLTTAFSCLSSISTCSSHLSTSSLFLPSLKDCLSTWEFRRATAMPPKDHDNQTCDYVQRKDQ
ncbi:deSI-like protein [Canna indica]|uniref:DeSI-like protein n=1 Tax=Canna indica TaxID=4628 RepID=A0AAQ3JPW7_9LILI|nr:deSI-like protein [Canna indica]